MDGDVVFVLLPLLLQPLSTPVGLNFAVVMVTKKGMFCHQGPLCLTLPNLLIINSSGKRVVTGQVRNNERVL